MTSHQSWGRCLLLVNVCDTSLCVLWVVRQVLIPVFAVGRAQELCLLLQSFLARAGVRAALYFSGGLTEQANRFYQLFQSWAAEGARAATAKGGGFKFSGIKTFTKDKLESPQPMVLFATPGMLNGGAALAALAKWGGDAKNLVVLPGFCLRGTPGHSLLQGAKEVTMPPSKSGQQRPKLEVECEVRGGMGYMVESRVLVGRTAVNM